MPWRGHPGKLFIAADQADDDALDADAMGRFNDNRLEILIGRLEANMVSLVINFLDGGLAIIDEGDDGLSIPGIFDRLDDNEVAVGDLFVAHGVAADAEGEAAAGVEIRGDGDCFAGQHRLDRQAGGDHAKKRKLVFAAGRRRL